jgi:hypothetical protein
MYDCPKGRGGAKREAQGSRLNPNWPPQKPIPKYQPASFPYLSMFYPERLHDTPPHEHPPRKKKQKKNCKSEKFLLTRKNH